MVGDPSNQIEGEVKEVRRERKPAINEIHLLKIETYEGSGQVVHPDVVVTPQGWSNSRLYLAITPYPNGNALHENPSIYTSYNALDWHEVAEGSNPIVRSRLGHLSDPDIVYNRENNELWLYYREVTSTNDILLMKSSDGIRWSEPTLVLSAPNHELLGPSIVRKGNEWLMWTVNGGKSGCTGSSTILELRRSYDGINWSEAEEASIPNGSVFPWHIEVAWIPSYNEFWAIYNGKTPGSCTTASLYFARSRDGLQWSTFRAPLLQRGVIPEFEDIVYRSAFKYEQRSDELTFWYSGAKYNGESYVWKAAVQRLKRPQVFELEGLAASLMGHTLNPPLTNETAP